METNIEPPAMPAEADDSRITSDKAVVCKEWFGSVFALLVSEGGAHESMRADFLSHHTSNPPCDEYRFQGQLGFGGKYWRKTNRVTCYVEDEDYSRLRILSVLNGELAKLPNSEIRRVADNPAPPNL